MQQEFLTGKATVSSKGQVVIPAALRHAAGIEAGTEVLFRIRADGGLDVTLPHTHSVAEFLQLGRKLQKKHQKSKARPVDVDEAIGQMMLRKYNRRATKAE